LYRTPDLVADIVRNVYKPVTDEGAYGPVTNQWFWRVRTEELYKTSDLVADIKRKV
jgi:hypothetical protein